VVPNTMSYNALISTCEKGRQPEWALKVVERMQQQQMVPDVITYSAWISVCKKGKQPERALDIFATVQQ